MNVAPSFNRAGLASPDQLISVFVLRQIYGWGIWVSACGVELRLREAFCSTEITSSQYCLPKHCTVEVRLSQIGLAKVGPAEICSGKIRPPEIRLRQLGTTKIGFPEIGLTKISTAKLGVDKICSDKISLYQAGITEIGLPEVSFVKGCTTEIAPGKVGFTEVRFHFTCTKPPIIPFLCASLQNRQMFSVRHRFSSQKRKQIYTKIQHTSSRFSCEANSERCPEMSDPETNESPQK